MILSHIYRFALVLLAGWFLTVQSFSAAHATTHAGEPHEHDGLACAVLVLVKDDLAVAPEFDVPSFIPIAPLASEFPTYTPVVNYLAPQMRGPPPRAPPVFL